MSGFGGHMTIYRQISIDRFDKKNLKSTVFLLSHCHRDHMIGLDQPNLLRCLQSRNDIFLYCSEVTKLLLLSEGEFRSLAPYIRILEIGVPTTVTIPDPESDKFKSVVVTALPAGHCLGSVMFLIEGKEGRALYTGDFRWEKNYATTLPALCVNGHIKEIDSMYVDTTFCVPEAFYIPSRDDCLSATASLVVSWLQQSSCRYIFVSSRTKYGHEPLLAHLAKEAKTKVHTTKEKLEIYEQITELRGVFTDDPSARIHACKWMQNHTGESRLPCGHRPQRESNTDVNEGPEVLVIRPSTMWFTNEPSRLQELVVVPASGRGLHRVCYSFHSSYSEVRDLVSLLRPREVYPNVLPASDTDWRQVKERLHKFLTYKHQHHMAPAGDLQTARPLGLLKRKRRHSLLQNLSDSEGLVFDSPEKPKQARHDNNNDDEEVQPSSQTSGPPNISPTKSDTHSSYQGSDLEEDMFAHSDEEDADSTLHEERAGDGEGSKLGNSQSLRSYVSGDEEVPEDEQVSSPQFRHLTSQDDKPGAQPELQLDWDDLRTPALSEDVKGTSDKDADPHVDVIPDSANSPTPMTSSSCLKERDKLEAKHFDVEQSKRSGEDGCEMPLCHDELRRSETECSAEARGKNTDENTTTSIGCSLQETAPFSCEKSEPSEKDDSEMDDCDGHFQMEQDSEVDSAVKRGNVSLNREAEHTPETVLTVNGGGIHRSKDGVEPRDALSSSEHGNACDLESKMLVSETDGETVSASVCDGSFSLKDGKNAHQDSAVDGKKTQTNSPGSKKTQACSSEDGKKSQNCSTEDGTDRQELSETDEKIKDWFSKHGSETQKCSSEDKKSIEDTKKTQECSSEHGEKTQDCISEDGKKAEEAKNTHGTHKGLSTNNDQETNIISSDSDSDVDCQITKSFIRKRPVNPWQKFHPLPPPQPVLSQPCPVHYKRLVAQAGPGASRFYESPDSKMDLKSSTTRAETNGKKSEEGVNTTREKRAETSIDLTSAEIDSSADWTEKNTCAEKREGERSVAQGSIKDVKSEQKDKNMPVDKSSPGDSNCSAGDADIEDNVEEEEDMIRNKKKVLPVSAHDNSVSKLRTTSAGSSDVIVIEDAENSVAGRDPSAKIPDPISNCGSAQNTHSHTHLYKCSCAAYTNRYSNHHYALSQPQFPFKDFRRKDPASASHTDGVRVKRARSDSGSSVHPSPEKETSLSTCPKKRQGLPKGSKEESSHRAKETPSSCASGSKTDSGPEEKSKEADGKGGDDEGEAGKGAAGEGESGEGKREEGRKEVEDDSDVTLPPDSQNSTLPPDSPVAVHSSESDSDADCRITQSFIRPPRRQGGASACAPHPHQAHCPLSPSRQCPSGPRPSNSQPAVLLPPQLASLGQCRPHCTHRAQSGTKPPSRGAGVKAESASVTKTSQQNSVIDLTEDD